MKLLVDRTDNKTPMVNGPSNYKHSRQDQIDHKQLLRRTYS
jgi:hypothetical protein